MSNRSGNKVVTFGEVLMRLSPAENRKIQQANQLDFFFGGTELNVAVSLAYLGIEVQHVSAVSNDIVGDAALAFIRQFGIDVSAIKKVEHPLGLYFLEVGSAIRSSKIAYNRLHGSFANIHPEDVDWNMIFENCSYFHWTGISPAISEGAYKTLKEGLVIAQDKGVIVSADPAYRSNLWKYGKDGQEVLLELVGLSNIFIGGVNEINEILNTDYSNDEEGFIAASKRLIEDVPGITKVFDKVRTGLSASWQKVYGRAWTGELIRTDELEITDVVDRIGTGDAYAAGLLYGFQNFEDDQKALEFANAACALKHTIIGDANLVSVEEILDVMKGNVSGRIKR